VGRSNIPVKVFLDAIPGTGGIITAIARRVGCSWHTADKYIKRYPTIQQAYRDECERVLDIAESKVIELISAGDPQMLRYYLSTKGKKRGYTERQEVTGENGAAIAFRIIYPDS